MKKLLLLPLLFSSFAQAEIIQCKVVGVTDGDTIRCLTESKEQIKVRLYQIDAPESGQAYRQRAKQALSDMIYGEYVHIETYSTDKYKRTLGTIRHSPCWPNKVDCSAKKVLSTNVNQKMIGLGYAWYWPFAKKNLDYIQAEKEAREAKRGLWADPDSIPPWEWRKQQKNKKK